MRLAYYPNPYGFVEFKSNKRDAIELLNNGDLTSDEYEQLISEADFTSDIPLIRFDYSPSQYCEKYHPAAHFHVGFFVDNRWSSRRVLSPYAFFLNILMNYYSHLWKPNGNVDALIHEKIDSAYQVEVSNCSLLDDAYFSEHEYKRLYVS